MTWFVLLSCLWLSKLLWCKCHACQKYETAHPFFPWMRKGCSLFSRNTLGMEQREIAGFTDKPMYIGRVDHYYLAGSSRPIEHAELGLQAYHTSSLPGQQPEQSGPFNNHAASAATLLNLINEEPFIACDQAKVTVENVPHMRGFFKYLGIVPNPGMLLGEGIKYGRGSQNCQTMPFSHCHLHKFHKCLRQGLPFASKSSHLYLYRAFNNTNCVKATAQYQNRKIVYH